ncbi:MAG TPA: Ppx/GppA family phosphatase [Stellaceae bacterium]|nr:Ppx/GppA family phosphatase [Stellaceae bacterium]
MPDHNAAAPLRRVAVVDVGSNSLRLVVFDCLGGALLPLLNEKVMCALGRDIAASGRLNPEGVELALANLQRFVELARALQVDHLAVIATAAVREASDGRAFAAKAERLCGVPMRIIAGTEEARLSAAGVLAGIRGANGIVADLGGGSVEVVRINADAVAPIGAGITLPLGPLRLAPFGDNRKALTDAIDHEIYRAAILHEGVGRTLYLVGGAWRAIARLHMDQVHYPLHIIHEYTVLRRPAEEFLDMMAGQSRRSLDRVTAVSRKRLELVPLAALILRRLLAAVRPERIVFSAYGLREGYASSLVPAGGNGDPLIAACIGVATGQTRSRSDGDRLQRWTAPVFPQLDESAGRLHRAVCWLSDFAWAEHPDYRAEHAFTRSLRMPIAHLTHRERVFIAGALHARYGGAPDDPLKFATRPLIDDAGAAEARALGLALRLAYTLCGGALELLDQVRLLGEPSGLALELPPSGSLFAGEAVQRRLDALSRALGRTSRTRRRRAHNRALA